MHTRFLFESTWCYSRSLYLTMYISMHLNTYRLDSHRDGAHNGKGTYNIARMKPTRNTRYTINVLPFESSSNPCSYRGLYIPRYIGMYQWYCLLCRYNHQPCHLSGSFITPLLYQVRPVPVMLIVEIFQSIECLVDGVRRPMRVVRRTLTTFASPTI